MGSSSTDIISYFNMNPAIETVILVISSVAAIVAAVYAYRAYLSSKSPRLVIEWECSLLYIRNTGTDIAKNIKELSGKLKSNSVPSDLQNFTGPIDYSRPGISGFVAIVSFIEKPRPREVINLHFEYENSGSNKFFSKIKIERTEYAQRESFKMLRLQSWGRFSSFAKFFRNSR